MDARHLFVFRVGEQRLALPLDDIESVARMVEIQALPGAPHSVLGVINYHGRIVPVLTLHAWLGLPHQPTTLRDWLVIVHLRERSAALVADEALGVWTCDPADITPADSVSPGLNAVTGVLRRENEMVVIFNLEQLLSSQEQLDLETLASMTAEELVSQS